MKGLNVGKEALPDLGCAFTLLRSLCCAQSKCILEDSCIPTPLPLASWSEGSALHQINTRLKLNNSVTKIKKKNSSYLKHTVA